MAVVIPEQLAKVINKVNEKNPYYLLLLTLSGLLIILYFFPIQFQVAALQSLGPKVKDLGQEVENSRNNIARMPQYQQELRQLKVKLNYVGKKVKAKEELPNLLETISRIAGKNSVKLEQVMPQAAAQQPVLENSDGKYFAVPIMVEAKSGYHEFGRFLNQLEQEGVFTELSEFTVVEDPGDVNRHTIRMGFKSILLEKKIK